MGASDFIILYNARNAEKLRSAGFFCERSKSAAERSEVGWSGLLGIFGASHKINDTHEPTTRPPLRG